MFLIGEPGGYLGADGVNPVRLGILVGDADRRWYEPWYRDQRHRPLGSVRTVVPQGPNDPDGLLDACLAFFPEPFRSCPSFSEVEASLRGVSHVDFDQPWKNHPASWARLREEARAVFAGLSIWKADFVPQSGLDSGS